MAAGESGAPGNGGNGVRHSKGTAKKLERSPLPNFPCPLRKGRGHGVAAGMRAVPEDASVPAGGGGTPPHHSQRAGVAGPQSRWHSRAGRESVQAENREQRQAQRLLLSRTFTGARGVSKTDLRSPLDSRGRVPKPVRCPGCGTHRAVPRCSPRSRQGPRQAVRAAPPRSSRPAAASPTSCSEAAPGARVSCPAGLQKGRQIAPAAGLQKGRQIAPFPSRCRARAELSPAAAARTRTRAWLNMYRSLSALLRWNT